MVLRKCAYIHKTIPLFTKNTKLDVLNMKSFGYQGGRKEKGVMPQRLLFYEKMQML